MSNALYTDNKCSQLDRPIQKSLPPLKPVGWCSVSQQSFVSLFGAEANSFGRRHHFTMNFIKNPETTTCTLIISFPRPDNRKWIIFLDNYAVFWQEVGMERGMSAILIERLEGTSTDEESIKSSRSSWCYWLFLYLIRIFSVFIE